MIEYEMLAECRAFLEYYRGVSLRRHHGRMVGVVLRRRGGRPLGASFRQRAAQSYNIPEEKIVYFRVHAEADSRRALTA